MSKPLKFQLSAHMNFTLPRVGILYSPLVQLDPLRNNVSAAAKVAIIDYRDTRVVDIMIIPHGGGLWAGAACFDGNVTGISASCGEIEYWRLMQLDSLIEKDVPIIGVGDGACLLWNYLGEKVRSVNGELRCITPDKNKGINVETDKDYDFLVDNFDLGNIYGFRKPGVGISRIIAHYTKVLNVDMKDDKEENEFSLED